MKSEQYKEYSMVFDTFSNLNVCPSLKNFSDNLIDYINKNSSKNKKIKVIDIGCGTGLFSKIILEKCPYIELTLVEPNPYMLSILKKRFKNQKNFKILELNVLNSLKEISPQDLFIFQRSMYTFSGDENFYINLEKKIRNLLNENGVIAIFDFSEKFNINAMYKYIHERKHFLNIKDSEFENQWEIIKKFQISINKNIEDGNFTLFSSKMRNKIFSNLNYKNILDSYFYSFFQKKK